MIGDRSMSILWSQDKKEREMKKARVYLSRGDSLHRLRGALNHPIPPMLETVPGALLSTSTAIDVLAYVSDDRKWLSKAAGYGLTVGLLGAAGASTFGIFAYLRKARHFRRVAPRRSLWNTAIVSSFLLSLRHRNERRADGPALLLSGLGATLIGLSRYLDAVKLRSKVLEDAFRSGLVTMADRWGQVGFYRTDSRSILEPDALHVEKNLARKIRKGVYDVRVNQDFEGTIRGCADRESTWISEEIIQAYMDLHRSGKAHSVEAYRENALVGGLFGVAAGGAFRVESQFYRARDASKVCFVYLVNRLKERDYLLLDLWLQSDHLARFGAVKISEKEYLARLRRALQLQRSFV
jgi:leucyl/phenylalanyl-tRNA---protein transferase